MRKGASSRATLNSAWNRCAKIQTTPRRVSSGSAAKLRASAEKSSAPTDHCVRSQWS
jgi:hypothetical protein